MSRQKPDPYERGRDDGPLFQPPERALSGRGDPETSRKAAASVLDDGTVGADQRLALRLLHESPGRTAKELGVMAAEREEPPWDGNGRPRRYEFWRQKLGRRLNEMEKAGLIRRDGERDGCCCWFPVEGR